VNKPENIERDNPSTEEKIKIAARIVFHKKGYAGTRTRDIAEEAGINLASLNYYFRTKEKLFDIIIMETMEGFFRSIKLVFNNEATTLEEKIEVLVNSYIDLLIANPDVPIFILSELRTNPAKLVSKIGAKEVIMKSSFIRQYGEKVATGEILLTNPLHFIMNLLSLTVFPFIASPIVKGLSETTPEGFEKLMLQRKTLIPKWINAILKTE
jgi:AcrR family transcriptional regulator